MTVFKNINKIKSDNNSNIEDLGIGYLKYCKKTIEEFIQKLDDDPVEVVRHLDDIKYEYNPGVGYLGRMYGIFRINSVKDIHYIDTNTIEVIFGVADEWGNTDHMIIFDREFYTSLQYFLRFIKFMLSKRGLFELTGIKNSIYDFTFKVDVKGLGLFSTVYFNVAGVARHEINNDLGLLTRTDNINIFVNMCAIIEKYFINYEKIAKVLSLNYWNFVELDYLRFLGNIFKAKKIIIPAFHMRKKSFKTGRLMPGLSHITTSDAKIIIDEVLPYYIFDIDEVEKNYNVSYEGVNEHNVEWKMIKNN